MIIITKEDLIKRISKKFENQPFEILEYTKMTKPFKIKCLKCGFVKQYSNPSNFLNCPKKGICTCYNPNNKKVKHEENKKKILNIIEKNNLEFYNFGYKEETKKYTVSIKCRKCNQIYTKPWVNFIKNSKCYFCDSKQKMNTIAYQAILPKEYTLLSEYKGQEEKILVRHKCGFIWKIKPHNLSSYIGCPKCNRKRSKGEQRISNYLNNKKICYSIEEQFSWQSNLKRRYDFFLPEFNLIIEYMGEQHYKETTLFKISLEEQKKIDQIKKEEAISNGLKYLEISYKNYNHIEEILDNFLSSTTIM